MARSTGLKRDLRLNKYTTYNNYYFLNFNSYITECGDSYDRFLLRLYEMTESLSIINQNLLITTNFKKHSHDVMSSVNNDQNSMEGMIDHFKF